MSDNTDDGRTDNELKLRPLQKISVIIPVYYNEDSLLPLFAEFKTLEQSLSEVNLALELIFVNDGSGDKSLDLLLEIKSNRPETKVVSLARNFGSTAAFKTGLKFATGDAVSMIAADLQDPPSMILELATHWKAGHKFVVCVRQTRDDPIITKAFAAIYYSVIRFLVAPNYPSGGFDLLLLDRAGMDLVKRSAKHMNPAMYSLWLGFPPKKIFYDRQARRFGKSRWTFGKKVKYFFDTITGFSVAPIRILSGFGLTTAILSLTYGASILVAALTGDTGTPGFATLAVLISFFSGIILVMLGVIGEYLWRIYEGVNEKPEAVIDAVFD